MVFRCANGLDINFREKGRYWSAFSVCISTLPSLQRNCLMLLSMCYVTVLLLRPSRCTCEEIDVAQLLDLFLVACLFICMLLVVAELNRILVFFMALL